MKKNFVLRVFALLMASCIIFAGCSKQPKPGTGEDYEGILPSVSSEGTDGESLLEKASKALAEKREMNANLDYDNLNVDVDVTLNLGEGFGEFVDLVSGTPVSGTIEELGLKSAKLEADFDRNGDVYSITADALVNDKPIVDADVTFDYNNEMLYFAVPELAEGTVGLDASEIIEDFVAEYGDSFSQISEMYESNLEAQNALFEGIEEHLSEEDVMAILEDYTETGMAEIDEPEIKKADISVDNITQNVDAHVYKITAEDGVNLTKAILEKLSDDEQIKEKFLALYPLVFDYLDVITYGEFSDYCESDAEDAYDYFLDEVDNMLDSLDDGAADDDTVIYITCYLNGEALAGFEVVDEESEFKLYFHSVRNGNDVAAVLGFDDSYNGASEFKLVGSDEGSVYNGVLTMNIYGDAVSIGIEDFDLNKLAEGSIYGTISMSAKDFPADAVESGLEDAEFKFTLDSDNITYTNLKVCFVNNGKNVCDLAFNFEFSDKADEISVPADYIDAEDQSAINEWIMNLSNNFSVITDNLIEAGISEGILGMLISNL